MTSKELIQSGHLAEARTLLTERVRSAPADTKSRVLLFQVLAYQGEWDKAARHLELLVSQSPESATGLLACRSLVTAEKIRVEVAGGRQTPDFMTESPVFYSALMEARHKVRENNLSAATALFDDISESLPIITGEIDGKPFTGFNECDCTLSGILEVFVHDRYLWFPFQSLRELSVEEPKSLLDLLWAPARIVTWDGLTTDCFLPTLYPGSSTHENELVQLGRMTDWFDLGNGCYQGVGQHTLDVAEQEMGILEIRDITFNPAVTEVGKC